MKLNHDCIRDLLLYLEDNLTIDSKIEINTLTLNNYSQDDLLYTAQKLIEADYIDCIIKNYCDINQSTIFVKSITYTGHQFLDNIRDNDVWKNTKIKISRFASISLPVIQEVASSFIKSQLGLN